MSVRPVILRIKALTPEEVDAGRKTLLRHHKKNKRYVGFQCIFAEHHNESVEETSCTLVAVPSCFLETPRKEAAADATGAKRKRSNNSPLARLKKKLSAVIDRWDGDLAEEDANYLIGVLSSFPGTKSKSHADVGDTNMSCSRVLTNLHTVIIWLNSTKYDSDGSDEDDGEHDNA